MNSKGRLAGYGRDIVITFGQEEAPALALRSPGWAFPRALIPGTGAVAERLRIREIDDDDEGRRLVRIIRRGSGLVVTWRRAQMVRLSAQGMDVPAIARWP